MRLETDISKLGLQLALLPRPLGGGRGSNGLYREGCSDAHPAAPLPGGCTVARAPLLGVNLRSVRSISVGPGKWLQL